MNPTTEEDLSDQNVRTNEVLLSPPSFAMIRFTFFLDVQSAALYFDDDVLPNEKHWGVVIKSKWTRDPVVAISVAEESVLKAVLDMVLKNPDAILQVSESTIITEPVLEDDGGKAVRVLQSLTVNNSFFGHSIESIDYYELDQEQLTDLLKTNNNIVKEKLAVDEAVEAEESAEELIPGNISEENA
jgi:hypothetical protein